LSILLKINFQHLKNSKKELFEQIKNLPDFPYKFRKSYYFDDEKMRDMTYKDYTIIYEVDLDNNIIIILNIFQKNKP